jgi:hypothetical protein
MFVNGRSVIKERSNIGFHFPNDNGMILLKTKNHFIVTCKASYFNLNKITLQSSYNEIGLGLLLAFESFTY